MASLFFLRLRVHRGLGRLHVHGVGRIAHSLPVLLLGLVGAEQTQRVVRTAQGVQVADALHLLDAKGGPNHVGNFCEAPVMLTEDGRDFSLMDEYWYIGQFSRFLRPGAVRLGASAWTAGIEVTAFENPDGRRAAVLLNRMDRELPVSLTQDGAQGYPVLLAEHSIATVCWGS